MKLFSLVLLVASSSSALAFNITFNGGMNTLPTAQGWNYFNTSGLAAPTISGGVLTVDGTQANTVRFYQATAADPTSFTVGCNISGLLQISTSGLGSGPNRRAGYYLAMTDFAGRVGHLGITDTGVFISTDLAGGGSPFVAMTTTDRPHFYNLTAVSDVLTLYVDGAPVISTGAGASGIYAPNDIWFADGSSDAGSLSSTHYVNFSSSPVPEPATLCVLGLGFAAMIRRRIRK